MSAIDHTTHDRIERRLSDIDWPTYLQRRFTPSPAAWEDQVLYFLMLDRFSDGNRQRDPSSHDGALNYAVGGCPMKNAECAS